MDTKNKVKILLVEFTGGDERIDLNYQIDKSQFERVAGSKELTFELPPSLIS